MKTVLQGTSFFLLSLCLLFTQCSKTPDTPVTPKSSTKTLTSPTIDGVAGASSTFDAATSTYTVTVPSGTDVTALKISFTLPTGATAKPTVGSAQNFTNPVVYTVTAEDGTAQTYTVKVVVTTAPKSAEKQITAFTFAALSPVVSATIDQATRKITAVMPASADLTSLLPTLTLSAKSTVSPASGLVQNFTNPVNYTVTAEDGSKQSYEVKVEKVAVINSAVACLLTRMESAFGGTSYTVDFSYDQTGRITGIKRIEKGVTASTTISYDSNGNVARAFDSSTGNFDIRFTYQNGKVIKMESTQKDGNIIDFIAMGAIKFNDKNEVIEFGSKINGVAETRLEHTNGNLTKVISYDEGKKKFTTYEFSYDNTNGPLSASKPDRIFTYLLINVDLAVYSRNNVNGTRIDGQSSSASVTFNYTFNKNNFPVEGKGTDSEGKPTSSKFIYANCQ